MSELHREGQDEPPDLSVVIGSHNAHTSMRDCLTSLRKQRNGCRSEIVVVDNSTDGTDAMVSEEFPDVTLIRSSAEHWIPELWEIGVRASRGSVVALTTAHCVPDEDWMKEILAAHRDSAYVGIGGAIETDDSASITGSAVYLCRYARYMRPFEPRLIDDIPADNASYKRWALDRCADVRARGFWEPDIHAKLIAEGHRLWLTPKIGVRHRGSFTLAEFLSQRFWHGRQFGSSRARGLPMPVRLAHILATPLVPVVMLTRIARQLMHKRRQVGRFLLASPILGLFLISWATGEAFGYLRPSPTQA
ncbi:MAG: glycosyltransferase [Nitrospiraceae bacterium]